MEPTETQVPQPGETPEAEKHDKPLLTVEQQIAHLKAKGVTFDLCDEEEAATYLSGKCNFFRVTASLRRPARRARSARLPSPRSSITLTRTPACWTNRARRYPPSGSSGA